MPNHRPVSKACLTAKKRETHRGVSIFGQQIFDADVPISVIALRRVAVEKHRVKYGEIIADNLSKAGFSWGCVSAIDSMGERFGLQTHIAANSG